MQVLKPAALVENLLAAGIGAMGVKGWREHLPFMQVNVNSHMGVNKKAVCENW